MKLEDQSTIDQSVLPEESQTLKAGVGEHRGEASSDPEQLDRFELERLLGQGGMGQVWEAWDPQLERRVAIKRLLRADPAARRRFVREGRLQATLAHPGICPVFEVGHDAGEPYLVMPRLDGVRLDEAVEGEPLEYKLDLMRQVADAVHAAHQQGLIHRDLKPANILVEQPSDAPPRPVVLDFGIARPVGGEMLTAPGEVVGTPAYMAPEQIEGASVLLDRRTDVYALGATLYRLLSGRPPHSGTGTPLLLSIVHEEPERLPSGDIPVEVEAIVFKCLEKDKNRRYDSARVLAEDLQRYLAGEPVHARPVTRWIRFGKWMRRHRAAVRITSAAAMLAVAGLTWGGWSTWRSGERQEAARQFGAQVEEIEALARYSHLVPLHDVREDRKLLRARLEAIRPSLDDRDPVIRALASHAMGRGHLAVDELEEAREYLESAYELDPENSEIAADLGRTLSEIYRDRLADSERFGDQKKRNELGKQLANRIEESLRSAAGSQEPPVPALGEPALNLLRRGQSGETESSVEIRALNLFHNGEFEAALDLLATWPRTPSWMYERWRLEGDIRRSWAVSLHRQQEPPEPRAAKRQLEEARRAYGRALEIAPSHVSLLIDDAQAVSLLIRLGLVPLAEVNSLIEDARQRLEQARIADPDGLESWLWAVRLELVAAGHSLDLAQDPTSHLETALFFGKQALQLGDPPSALWFELGRAHEQLARQQIRSGQDPAAQLKLASNAFDRVAPADRDYAYFTSLGTLRMSIAGHLAAKGLQADDSYASAITAYRSAAKQHSRPYAALLNLGVTLFQSAHHGRVNRKDLLTQASKSFEESRRLGPENMEAFYYLGLTQQRLAQEVTREYRLLDPQLIERALTNLKRAVELSPDHFAPQLALAGAIRLQAFDAFNRGNNVKKWLDEARIAHQRALELAPQQPIALLNAGQVEFLAGRSAFLQGLDPNQAALESESFCRRSLEALYHANALYCIGDALSLLAEYRLDQGEVRKARRFIERAELVFNEAIRHDPRHLGTLQSYANLQILEARRLREAGKDPTRALEQADRLLDEAWIVDPQELASSLIKSRWYLEQALWLHSTQRNPQKMILAGRRGNSEVLAKAPRSTEALRLEHLFAEIGECSLI